MKYYSVIIPACFSLIACGGGGSSDSNTPSPTPEPATSAPTTPSPGSPSPTNSSVNKSAISTGYAGIQSASQMLSAENAKKYRGLTPVSGSNNGFQAQPPALTRRKSSAFSNSTSKVSALLAHSENTNDSFQYSESETERGDCGGHVDLSLNSNQDFNAEPQYPVSLKIDATFDDYCEQLLDDLQVITDGVMDADVTLLSEEAMKMSFNFDMSITEHDDGETFNTEMTMNMSCSIDRDSESCEFSTQFEDDSGNEFSFYLDDESGDFDDLNKEDINFSGKFMADVEGESSEFNLAMSGVDAQTCDNGNFSSGSLTIESDDKEDIEITFNDCDTFTLTHNGISDILEQPKNP